MSHEYFERVTQALVMRLRQHEEDVIRSGKALFYCFLINFYIMMKCKINLPLEF